MSIIIDGGRFYSKRTKEESIKDLSNRIEDLSESEFSILQELLLELAGESSRKWVDQEGVEREFCLVDLCRMVEYEHEVVGPEEWIEDPYYFGKIGKDLFPKLKEDFIDLFSGNYHEVIMTGAIGTGKTFFSNVCIVRMLYEMSCLRNPQRSYGQAKDQIIAVAVFHVTKDLARKVILESIGGMIRNSPYFMEKFKPKIIKNELIFPNNIWVAPLSSTARGPIGLNLFGGVFDEANFKKEPSKHAAVTDPKSAKALYNAIVRRMKSRFGRAGKLPGLLMLPSSKQTEDDFTQIRILEAKNDPSIFVRDYCFTGDTKVSLMDGRELSFFELEKEFGKDKSFEVYSWNGKDFVPGKAKGVVLTRKNVPVVKVTLDNGKSERCTYDHPWMLRNGNYCRAIDLKPGDSLMPLYRRKSNKKTDGNLDGYDMWRDPNTGKWIFTHRINAREKFGHLYKRGKIVHHENFNKLDNSTSNLKLMENDEHIRLHSENMDVLLKYVKSDKHRKYASEHMSRLHTDKKWAKKRDDRSRKNLKQARNNPKHAKKFIEASSRNLKSWLQSDRGRAENKKRALENSRKRRYHHITTEKIIYFIDLGMNKTEIAKYFNCSQALIGKRLKHLGGFTNVVKKRNHCVVSVEPDGVANVYDIQKVEKYHNFALSSGVVVHNSQWDVLPQERFSKRRFRVFVGSSSLRSRVLEEDEKIEITDDMVEDGCQIIEVPEDFRLDFEGNIDDALRDLAGIATITIKPFIMNRSKIYGACDKRKHPFEFIEWDTDSPLTIKEKLLLRVNEEKDESKPILNPEAPRFIHIDPSLTSDSTGFAMGHIAEYVNVVRRNRKTGQLTHETAPIIVIDLMLRIVPPKNGEIDHGAIRELIYTLSEMGFPVRYVSMDSYQSAGIKQKLRQKGYASDIISVDRKMDPYDMLKEALYEDRITYYKYRPFLDEIKDLIEDKKRKKVDHLPDNSKDVADAVCGVVYALSTKTSGEPLPIMESMPYKEDSEDHSWVIGSSKKPKKDKPMPFLIG